MKIYIVQPMRGRSKEEILEERELGKRVAQVYYPNAEFLDSYYEDYDESKSPLWYLAKSCEMMAQADLIVMLPFYFGTPGCDLESHIAEVYGIPRLMVNYHIEEDGSYPDVYDVTTHRDAFGNTEGKP